MSIRVLIVDDSAAQRLAIKQILVEAGYEVITASDGNEGLMLWRDVRPDLVITDILMPEEDGFELIMKIRQAAANTPILAISASRGRGGMDYLAMAQRLGADGVLAKPFRAEQLLRAVKSVLDGRGSRLLADGT